MSKVIALARRELIEHRTGIVYAPVIIFGLVLLVIVTSLGFGGGLVGADIGGSGENYTSLGDLLHKLSEVDPPVRAGIIVTFLSTLTLPALLVLPFVIFFIMLGGLYEERRDRSFLFWKSMPVSDTWEVMAKLGAGLLMAPLCFFLVGVLAQIVILLAFTVIGAVQGSAVGDLWQIGAILRSWLHTPLFMLMWALWAAPVFAWVLFCGAYAPRAPFMYAVLPPVVIMVFEGVYLDSAHFAEWIGRHLAASPLAERVTHSIVGAQGEIRNENDFHIVMEAIARPDFGSLFTSLGHPDLWVGIAIAALLVYGAIWLRRYNL